VRDELGAWYPQLDCGSQANLAPVSAVEIEVVAARLAGSGIADVALELMHAAREYLRD